MLALKREQTQTADVLISMSPKEIDRMFSGTLKIVTPDRPPDSDR
jgi:hypothetical protein